MRNQIPKHIAARTQRTIRLHGRTYFLLEQLGMNVIEHGALYRAFVPSARPGGVYRAVHVFEKSRMSWDRIRRLKLLDDHSEVTSLPHIEDYDVHGREFFIALRWVRGHMLREHLEGARKVNNQGHKGIVPLEAIKSFVGFSHALAHLHRQLNLVHGDLKPENLIVHPHRNRLVMIDFGSAWLAQETTRRGERDGIDVHYAAPEMQVGGFADFRSDLFSASAILYEMLTLRRPYEGIGGKAGLDRFKAEYASSYVAPSRACDGAGATRRQWETIDRFVETGLRLDADQRFKSPREWLDAIDGVKAAFSAGAKRGVITRVFTALGKPLSRLHRRERE